MSEELKPCPFCGWQPAAEHHSWQGHTVEIGCPNPDCPMMNVDTGLLKPEKAKAAWNTRPIEDALRAEVARLTAELAEARDGIADLWNLCEILPHNQDCDVSGTGYCDCNRGIFNSTIQNIMDANHMGEG